MQPQSPKYSPAFSTLAEIILDAAERFSTLVSVPEPLIGKRHRVVHLPCMLCTRIILRMKDQRGHYGPGCLTTRSAVSNRSQLLKNVDGRSSSARRFKDLVRNFEAEVGGPISAVEHSLITQAACMQLRSEQLQADVVNGVQVDSDALIRLAGTVRRLLAMLSAKATKRKSASPTIADHIATRAAALANTSRE